MRRFLLFYVLLGMLCIHAPKDLLHDCVHETKCHNLSCCDQNPEEHDLSIDIADCDLCAYTFHSIDTPNFPLVLMSATPHYAPLVMQPFSVSTETAHNMQLRGPPAIVMI